MIEKINPNLLKEITKYKSFMGKKILLTLAINQDEDIETVFSLIRVNQAGVPTKKDRDQAKLISEMVKKTISRLSEIKSFPKKGCVLFSGCIGTPGGRKEFLCKIVIPLVDGYENYFRGHLDSKFYVGPFQIFLNQEIKEKKQQEEEALITLISKIEKDLSNKSSKIVIGASHVKNIINNNRAERVIMSKKLKRFRECPSCKALNETENKKCSYCGHQMENTSNFYDKIKNLCEKYDVELVSFEEDSSKMLDDKYYSICCFTKY